LISEGHLEHGFAYAIGFGRPYRDQAAGNPPQRTRAVRLRHGGSVPRV